MTLPSIACQLADYADSKRRHGTARGAVDRQEETKRSILECVDGRNLTIKMIAAELGMHQSTITTHVRELERAERIRGWKRERTKWYTLPDSERERLKAAW